MDVGEVLTGNSKSELQSRRGLTWARTKMTSLVQYPVWNIFIKDRQTEGQIIYIFDSVFTSILSLILIRTFAIVTTHNTTQPCRDYPFPSSG